MSARTPLLTETEDGYLSDSVRHDGPFRPFSSDPGWNEAWWWLGIPALVAILLIAFGTFTPEFYSTRILPEGYGALEVSHFFIPFAGFVIAVRLLFRPFVRRRKLVFAFLCLAALACFYIAGEEHSWGQHFFKWQTPEYWAQINKQQETNLHNTLHHFDKKPRILLEFGVVVGGLIIPALARFRHQIRRNRWSLFLPADAMVPTALGTVIFKISDKLLKTFGIAAPVPRPSEAIEFFLYLFILFYLIIFARRIRELEQDKQSG
ncbi:MAG: RNA recognition motif domain-containing protein [Hyphomicrobiaceae bacterium]|nr:RNA recognition motif domain-containing protein [Hyphomicrobiaceae bacterium]